MSYPNMMTTATATAITTRVMIISMSGLRVILGKDGGGERPTLFCLKEGSYQYVAPTAPIRIPRQHRILIGKLGAERGEFNHCPNHSGRVFALTLSHVTPSLPGVNRISMIVCCVSTIRANNVCHVIILARPASKGIEPLNYPLFLSAVYHEIIRVVSYYRGHDYVPAPLD